MHEEWAANNLKDLVLPERPEWLLIPHSWPEAAECGVRSPVLLLSPAYLPPCQPHGAFSRSPPLSAFLLLHPLILFKGHYLLIYPVRRHKSPGYLFTAIGRTLNMPLMEKGEWGGGSWFWPQNTIQALIYPSGSLMCSSCWVTRRRWCR